MDQQSDSFTSVVGGDEVRRPTAGIGALYRAVVRSPELGVGGILLLAIVLVAIFAPVISPHDPNQQNLRERLMPPVWLAGGESTHLLGTDQVGRDILTRIMYGGRISLLIGVSSVAVAGLFGCALGCLSGYYGGKVDALVMRLADIQLGFPTIVLAILLVATFGTGLYILIGILAFSGWVVYARIIRSVVLGLKEQEFVEASRALGAGDSRIIGSHILPHIFSPLMIVATVQIGQMVLLAAALSFLGMGVQPPTASWGVMISEGKAYLFTAWWVTLFPGLALTMLVLGTNLVGDAWRDLANK